MRFLKSPKRIFVLITLIIVIVGICFSQSPIIVKSLNKMLPPFAFIHKKELNLTIRKTNLKCKHVEVIQKKFAAEKALEAYVRMIPRSNNLRKQKIDKASFSYTTKNNGFCATCQKKRFLGIRDNQVVVIYGTMEKPGPVQENTGIDISKLPTSEVIDLKNGIPLKDDKEKLQLIEGLNGLFTN